MSFLSRLALPLSLSLCLSSPAWAQDETVEFTPDDPVMNAAILEARSHLDTVLSNVIDPDGQVHPALNLKIDIPVTHFDVDNEIIWTDSIARNADGTFTGHFANAPAYMPGASLGDAVTFTKDQVADWSVLSSDGRMFGHYTTRVILSGLEAAEAEQIRALLSADPFPESWR